MKEKIFGKYLWLLIIGTLLIAVYKTFDNIGHLLEWLKYFFGILSPVAFAFGIAFLLYPLCVKVEKLLIKQKLKIIKKYARSISVVSVYIIILAFLVTVPSLFMPYITKNINELIIQFPNIINKVLAFLDKNNISTDFISQNLTVDKLLKNFDYKNVNQYITSLIGAGTAIFDAFICIILSIYILIDRKSFKIGFLKIVNLYIKPQIWETIRKYAILSKDFVYKYVFCQLIDACVVIILSSILLIIMRVRYSVILGIFMGLMNLIPYFGAITACIVITVITICSSGLSKGLWLLLALIILQQVDSNLIQPVIVKEGLSVKPFWVLVGIIIGGALFGLIGILLAVPFVAIAKTIIEDILAKRENVYLSKNNINQQNNQ